jgi:hypothetical protein
MNSGLPEKRLDGLKCAESIPQGLKPELTTRHLRHD